MNAKLSEEEINSIHLFINSNTLEFKSKLIQYLISEIGFEVAAIVRDSHVLQIVLETTNYSAFKIIGGNRDIRSSNVHHIKKSFVREYLISPVIVNSRFEIIDGQNRFVSAKELGLPIRYIIEPSYGIKEVQIYNSAMQKWIMNDYVKSHSYTGNESYKMIEQFSKEFPDFSTGICALLLSDSSSLYSRRLDKKTNQNISINTFQSGDFEVKNLEKAYLIAENIMMCKPYFNKFNNVQFIRAMISVHKIKKYDHSRFINKLSQNPQLLRHQAGVADYVNVIEFLYNYRVQIGNKTNLRFDD